MKKKVQIEQTEDIVSVKILAQAIADIAQAAKRLVSSGLTEETLVVLLHEHAKVGKPTIRAVLRTLPELASLCLQDSRKSKAKNDPP